ncbi:uncharacterized protein BO97DRAFT_381181 [Aspergillus homomorphus CBS 101889]|uniref:Uncharacterized protein n=1 Tax=Aspergillus homomorphus (strain CBS 101889) TaxID=1450537 RepID=A0A395IEN6_ASPHC|nr:hypothetical protein BO97DRAFT_381181 [Aspergillus homomorphus CBS 101889]RAL17628.1 hypothetical protein BO97DRAFT_381181 [Aspergillus homomorphus CBS 101889]
MGNATETINYGWVASPEGRGSIDILWSCCTTVLLCCWVSVYPNVGSPNDSKWHPLIDKFNLFCISLLGPDFLFGIAWGQFESARRSVKLFRTDERFSKDFKWTYKHAFFVDMGGIHLRSPDFPEGFPIDAQQLHYLISHRYVDIPDMEQMAIEERNSVDTLSRIIAVFQAFWFFISTFERFRLGFSVTTLELTTVAFTLVMFATSVTWCYKPCISKPRYISTKDDITVQAIRDAMKRSTHPLLPGHWYRTPLDYITHDRFGIDIHWKYYTRLAHILHIPIFSRPVRARPWDRFPSDTWLCPDYKYSPLALIILLGFSALFLVAWDFYFPTYTEKIMWRISSVYNAAFSIYGGVYYLIEMYRSKRRAIGSKRLEQLTEEIPTSRPVYHHASDSDPETLTSLRDSLLGLQNISEEHDPEMAVSLPVLIPVTITCALYVFARGYIYVEDFISLRAQPSGVYADVNKFLPFLG